MHENQSCKNVPKRHELANYSDVIVKITEKELRWLIPMSVKLKKLDKPLPEDHITIMDVEGEWQTLIHIQEESPGKYRVWAYAPFNCHNKKSLAVIKGDDDPFFSLTFNFILGVVKCENFTSKKANKEKVWKDFQLRIIPVILYLQNFAHKAQVIEKQVKVKAGKCNKKFSQKMYILKKADNDIPSVYFFAGKLQKIQTPNFKENFEEESGISIIVPTIKDVKGIQIDASKVRNEMRKLAKKQKEKMEQKYPLYNSKKDAYIAKKISCIRAIAEDKTFMQLEIIRLEENVYQLSYFENSDSKCLMIILVNLACQPAQYDIVYTERGDGSILYDDNLYAKRISNFYMDILLYLRNYEFGNNKIIFLEELPKIPKEFWTTTIA